jgi:hypothetical protein
MFGIERDAMGQTRFALPSETLVSGIQGKNLQIEPTGMEDTEQ